MMNDNHFHSMPFIFFLFYSDPSVGARTTPVDLLWKFVSWAKYFCHIWIEISRIFFKMSTYTCLVVSGTPSRYVFDRYSPNFTFFLWYLCWVEVAKEKNQTHVVEFFEFIGLVIIFFYFFIIRPVLVYIIYDNFLIRDNKKIVTLENKKSIVILPKRI